MFKCNNIQKRKWISQWNTILYKSEKLKNSDNTKVSEKMWKNRSSFTAGGSTNTLIKTGMNMLENTLSLSSEAEEAHTL